MSVSSRRHSAPLSRSALAGCRFPVEVVTVAVRWYLRSVVALFDRFAGGCRRRSFVSDRRRQLGECCSDSERAWRLGGELEGTRRPSKCGPAGAAFAELARAM